MDSYRTEEEQVEAIRRWWDENGRSTIAAIVLALMAGFGWQYWKGYDQQRAENASLEYQALIESLNSGAVGEARSSGAKELGEQLKNEYSSSAYAQFAALHLAKLAVVAGDSEEAQAQLRWVLSKAPAKSDIAGIAQLRLARVLASFGDADQALDILATGENTPYAASYAIARGDIYMQLERYDEARSAYDLAKSTLAQSSVQGNIATLDQKIQRLNPIPARQIEAVAPVSSADVEESPENQEG